VKIFFVDDEPLTLDFLENIIDWQSLNIELMGNAGNGKEALRQIENNLPDILITDIRMPVMDGISLIDEVRRVSGNTRIIVLSAYSDFEYARKVFSSGISGYLVKPIDEQKLQALIEKTIEELKAAGIEKEKNSFSRDLAADTLLWEQMTSPDSEEIFYGKLKKLEKAPDLSKFQMLSLTFPNRSVMRSIILKSLEGSGIINSHIIQAKAGNWLILLEEAIGSATVKALQKVLRDNQDTEAFITVSALHDSPLQLCDAFNEINYLNSLRFYSTDYSYIFYRKRAETETDSEIKLNETAETYLSLIKKQKSENLHTYVGDINDKLIIQYEADIAGYLNFWTLFCMFVRTELYKTEQPDLIPLKLQKMHSRSFQSFNNSSQVTDFLKGLTEDILTTSASVSGDSSPVKDIKTFLKNHYSEKLTLEDIAENFSMSKNYLSRLFKDTVSCTLWDYLTMIRIDQAKKMLRQSTKSTAEIAILVGYDNQGYFSSVFRKKTGLSPHQYRKNCK